MSLGPNWAFRATVDGGGIEASAVRLRPIWRASMNGKLMIRDQESDVMSAPGQLRTNGQLASGLRHGCQASESIRWPTRCRAARIEELSPVWIVAGPFLAGARAAEDRAANLRRINDAAVAGYGIGNAERLRHRPDIVAVR